MFFKRFISLSQPQVNNLLLAGCLICFVSIFLIGIPNNSLKIGNDTFSAMCHARVTLIMYGYSLAYGAMFSKVYLVQKASQEKEQLIDSWKFYAVVGVLVGIDTVVALVWILSDPLLRDESSLEERIETAEYEIKYQEKMENCLSRHQYVWIGIVYVFKGLFLVFGLFLAYEIRNIKAKHVNDSRFVGMAIYNVAILSLITGSVSVIIVSQPDAAFLLISITILLCGYISMGLIFGPKIFHVIHYDGNVQTRSSTDNQLTPEEQERLKRLLVENEDIKRQIAEKETKIVELKRRLEAKKAAAVAEKQQQNSHQLEDPKCRVTVALHNESVTPRFEPEDSGYKSSNGRPGSQVEPIETDVLL